MRWRRIHKRGYRPHVAIRRARGRLIIVPRGRSDFRTLAWGVERPGSLCLLYKVCIATENEREKIPSRPGGGHRKPLNFHKSSLPGEALEALQSTKPA